MECPNLCSFFCQLKTVKLFNKCGICIFRFLKSILRSTSIQWFLLIWNVCYNKKSLLCQLVVLNIYRKQSLRVVLWNHFKSGNIETLYLLSALKEPVQINYKNHALLWNKDGYQHSADIFIKNIFNPIYGTGLNLYSLKYIRKSEFSWCFQRA